jgi:hypothetical protein
MPPARLSGMRLRPAAAIHLGDEVQHRAVEGVGVLQVHGVAAFRHHQQRAAADGALEVEAGLQGRVVLVAGDDQGRHRSSPGDFVRQVEQAWAAALHAVHCQGGALRASARRVAPGTRRSLADPSPRTPGGSGPGCSSGRSGPCLPTGCGRWRRPSRRGIARSSPGRRRSRRPRQPGCARVRGGAGPDAGSRSRPWTGPPRGWAPAPGR